MCDHVANSIEQNQPLVFGFVFDEWWHPSMLCDRCIERLSPFVDSCGQALNTIAEASAGDCFDCVAEWMLRQSLGSYDDLIVEAYLRLMGLRVARIVNMDGIIRTDELVKEFLGMASRGFTVAIHSLNSKSFVLRAHFVSWGEGRAEVEIPSPRSLELVRELGAAVDGSPRADGRHPADLGNEAHVFTRDVWFYLATSATLPDGSKAVTFCRPGQQH